MAAPWFTPSTWNCTQAMARVGEEAVAPNATEPDTVPAVGAVTLTTGGTPVLDIVTVTPVAVLCCPCVSVAMAVRVWEPLEAVLLAHCLVYGPVPVMEAPRLDPSSWNCTDAIPIEEDAAAA